MADEVDLFGNPILPREAPYSLLDATPMSVPELREADHEIQMEAMRRWFLNHYEDPAESTPYISSEGGYQYIHGGPYDAQQVLQEEFEGVVPDEVIEELADELNGLAADWAPVLYPDFDDYVLDSITESTEHYYAFFETLTNTRRLARIEVPLGQQTHFYRLLYVSAIIAFETYLSDTFISKVFSDAALIRKFVEKDRYFSKDSVPVKEVFAYMDEINDKVKRYLLDIVWHRISDSRRMFLETLGILFPEDLTDLENAIRIRHDIIHRSGKTKDGTEHQLNRDDVEKVATTVDEIVRWIESHMNAMATRMVYDPETETGLDF